MSGVGRLRDALGNFPDTRIGGKQFRFCAATKCFARVVNAGPNLFCAHGNPGFKWDLGYATAAPCSRRAIKQSLLSSIKNLLDSVWNGDLWWPYHFGD